MKMVTFPTSGIDWIEARSVYRSLRGKNVKLFLELASYGSKTFSPL